MPGDRGKLISHICTPQENPAKAVRHASTPPGGTAFGRRVPARLRQQMVGATPGGCRYNGRPMCTGHADDGPSPRSRTMKLTIPAFLLGVVTISAGVVPTSADMVTV